MIFQNAFNHTKEQTSKPKSLRNCAESPESQSLVLPATIHRVMIYMCERFNRTLLNMLGTLESEQKKNRKAYVEPLVHAYNCTQHDSTGFSLYYLMFGRHPSLPFDIAFGIRKEFRGSNYIKISKTC